MRDVSVSCKGTLLALLFLPLAFLVSGARAAGTPTEPRTFTVQTGTFDTLERAERHYNALVEKLPERYREDLRIEVIGKYFVVRTGSFPQAGAAQGTLAAARIFSRDAFIIVEGRMTDKRIRRIYPDVLPEDSPFVLFVMLEDGAGPTAVDALGKIVGPAFRDRIDDGGPGPTGIVRIGPIEDFTVARALLRTLRREYRQVVLRAAGGKTVPLPFADETDGDKGTTGKRDVTVRVSIDESGDAPPADDPPAFIPEDQVKTFDEIDREMDALMESREYGKAVTLIRRAIKRWPENPELHAWYGNVLLTMDRPDKAVKPFRKAAELAPAVPAYQSDLGHSLMYVHMDSAKEAVRAFKKALALDPENTDALEGLGTIYVSIGKTDEAQRIAADLERLDPEAAGRLNDALRYGIDWGN